MREDVGLGRNQLGGIGDLGQDVLRLEIDDAAEAGDQMRGLELDPVEREIGEAGEHLRLRLTRRDSAGGIPDHR